MGNLQDLLDNVRSHATTRDTEPTSRSTDSPAAMPSDSTAVATSQHALAGDTVAAVSAGEPVNNAAAETTEPAADSSPKRDATADTKPAAEAAATATTTADATPSPTGTQPTAVTSTPANTQQAPQHSETAPTPAPEAQRAAPKKGWLSVTVEPRGEVYVDGQYRGESPPARRIELTRGAHTLEVRSPKHEMYHEAVNITAGELSNRNVYLKTLKGQLSIATDAGAEVYVDGTLIGITPINRAIELAAGKHLVTIKKAGFNTWNNEITIDANRALPLKIVLSPIF